MAAERGHDTTVLEAHSDPGAQTRLTAKNLRGREVISIIDLLMFQYAARDVAFHFKTREEVADATALRFDVVIVATIGMCNLQLSEMRQDAANGINARDMVVGYLKPASSVAIYDESGERSA